MTFLKSTITSVDRNIDYDSIKIFHCVCERNDHGPTLYSANVGLSYHEIELVHETATGLL